MQTAFYCEVQNASRSALAFKRYQNVYWKMFVAFLILLITLSKYEFKWAVLSKSKQNKMF